MRDTSFDRCNHVKEWSDDIMKNSGVVNIFRILGHISSGTIYILCRINPKETLNESLFIFV